MKTSVFWDLTPCGSCKDRRFGGKYNLHRQGITNRLLVTANVVPSSSIIVTLMMQTIRSSETSVFIRVSRHHIPEDDIIHRKHKVSEKLSVSVFR
jgi:hypothetical protein